VGSGIENFPAKTVDVAINHPNKHSHGASDANGHLTKQTHKSSLSASKAPKG